jgi:polar amino acid transport system substrate-binding protein
MSRKLWFVIVLIILAAIGLFLANYFLDRRPPDRAAIVSGHPEWPPIMYQAGDKIVGAGPEIITKALADLGLIAEFKAVGSWDVAQEKARSGEVDFLVAAYLTKEREEYMDYSIPYTVDPISLVVKADSEFPYEKWTDLVGKKGVVMVGDSYGQQFDTFIKDNLDVQVVNSAAAAFDMIVSGQADYFVYALYSAEKDIAQNDRTGQVKILPEYVSTENFYLTVSKKSPFAHYLPEINERLQQYKNDGTIDGIINAHKELLWK